MKPFLQNQMKVPFMWISLGLLSASEDNKFKFVLSIKLSKHTQQD